MGWKERHAEPALHMPCRKLYQSTVGRLAHAAHAKHSESVAHHLFPEGQVELGFPRIVSVPPAKSARLLLPLLPLLLPPLLPLSVLLLPLQSLLPGVLLYLWLHLLLPPVAALPQLQHARLPLPLHVLLP
jgi:hypothetical protein